jgi:hypothetical protein
LVTTDASRLMHILKEVSLENYTKKAVLAQDLHLYHQDPADVQNNEEFAAAFLFCFAMFLFC